MAGGPAGRLRSPMRVFLVLGLVLVVASMAAGAGAASSTTAKSAAKPPSKASARPTAKPTTKPKTPSATPAVGVRQQDDEYVDPAILKEVFTSSTEPSDAPTRGYGAEGGAGGSEGAGSGEDKEPLSQEFICSVFGGPSCPDSQPINVPCICEDGSSCQCVPYYQCDKSTGSFNEFGVGVIDIRQGQGNSSSQCPHYIYKCCRTPEGGHAGQPTQPSGVPEPHQPSYPEEPHQPTSPQEPQQPTYPQEPQQPTYPQEPQQPTYPQEPQQPTYPQEPHQPTYPQEPQQPTYPQEPTPNEPSYNPNPGPSYPKGPNAPDQPHRCGQRNPEGIGVRITGDTDGEAQFGEFPWMVAILKVEEGSDEKKRNLYQCGGALLTPQVVLTAAHCVKNKNAPHQLKIRAGEWDTQTSKEMYRHQDVRVEEIVIHPEYYAGAVHNDMALLFLADPVHIGYHIGTICMPEQNQNFDYNKCFVSGWGKDKFGQQGRYQVILKKLELPIVPHGMCQEQLRRTRLGQFFNLHHSFICAGGEEGKDTCKGDGGSPLVCPMPADPSRYQVAGTVAWGIDCGLPDVPGVYGKVSLFRDWVDEHMARRHINTAPYLPFGHETYGPS